MNGKMLIAMLYLCGAAVLLRLRPKKPSPPELAVECGNRHVVATRGAYFWSSHGSSTIAGGKHILELVESMSSISRDGEEEAALIFDVEPISVAVKCWSDRHAYADDKGNYETGSRELVYDNGRIDIPTDGSYVYEVYAVWENGSAHYGFYIVEQAG